MLCRCFGMFWNGTVFSEEFFYTETFKCAVIAVDTGGTVHAIAQLTVVRLITMFPCVSFTAPTHVSTTLNSTGAMYALVRDAWVGIIVMILAYWPTKSFHTDTHHNAKYSDCLYTSIKALVSMQRCIACLSSEADRTGAVKTTVSVKARTSILTWSG